MLFKVCLQVAPHLTLSTSCCAWDSLLLMKLVSLFDPIRLEGDGRAAQRKARGESFVTANGAFLSP